MTTGYLAAQTPQINIPFLNIDGTVSQVWLLFLIQLFQRTGGSTSPTYTLTEIEQLALLNLSVVNANGFNGIVTSGQNATLTIETTVTGIVKGNGTALSAATPGVDYSIIDSIGVTVPPDLLSITPSSLSSSGTFAISLTTQASNTLLAGPITGVAATPTFRGLVSTDIPALNYVSTLTTQGANQILAGPVSGSGAAPTFRSLTTADITGLGVGTVTSVGMTVPSILSVTPSTITTSGSFALSLTTESANQIFAGPSSGSAATPTFRALTTADIPALSYGSVTSVGLSLPSIFTVTGSPVTTSGTLTATLATETANYVFSGPTSGSAASPTFRALVASDLPTTTVTAGSYTLTNLTVDAYGRITSVSNGSVGGGTAPVTVTTSTYSVGTTDLWLINNYAGTLTLTLPTASSYLGRQLNIQNYQAFTVVSASSNVVQIDGSATNTSILLASSGDRCTLVSNGTNWVMTDYTPNNILLLN